MTYKYWVYGLMYLRSIGLCDVCIVSGWPKAYSGMLVMLHVDYVFSFLLLSSLCRLLTMGHANNNLQGG